MPNLTSNPNMLVFLLFAIINFVGFVLSGVDKYKAARSLWRIRERTFFWFVLMGGALGVYLGLLLFRHKTRHLGFMIGIPLIFAFQVLGIVFLYILSRA
ncbi:MAG TPA: DUF1294 domain-containing protein [Acetivibrio sp.]|uniref:DUF1294 domain-containing protein n=1 Tax=Acetivibrio sp. TaxID=1872092 RepID=UPI002C78786A|nr:DUF1294 domain-containing protein [Acetivibrio sp.]HOM01948.1 DUF1294 domain-containing protein [Acetivibrio sp.]